ncbi:MAG TPA: methyl-accepting chemotaxis protein, partial [Myxococcaceae bacterium]|nr:methyl-accepting chemotaxis protein [Myxococcaceae bacterium]
TQLPDQTFWVNGLTWGLGSLVVVLGLVAQIGWPLALRIFLLALVFGAGVTLLEYPFAVLRGRRAIALLVAAGLSSQDVIDAVPPRRRQMRARLIALTVVSVMAPTVLVVELGIHRTGEAMERVFAEQLPAERDAALARIERGHEVSLAVIGVLAAILVAVGARGAGTVLVEPMRAMSEQARRIAEGDFSAAVLVPAEDELWAASAAFATMHNHLGAALGRLQRAGVRISSTTEELVQMSSRHQTGAAEQLAALNQTMATTEELARSARQIAENASRVAAIAEQTLGAARAGRRNAEAFTQSMKRMRRDNQGIADSVVRLNKRVQQIGKIVEFINGIADKSDLLALNAELEGTKAGEVGRGFSLVAAEMRRVAENVLSSTQQISTLIEDIRDATNSAVMATEAGVKATDAGSAHSADLAERLRIILDLASSTSDASRAISLATQQQQAGTDQLALAMANVLEVTQQGAQSTRQMSSANADLVALAKDLTSAVERFRVG